MWLAFADGITATASAARLHDGLAYELDVSEARSGAHALFRGWTRSQSRRADWLCRGPSHHRRPASPSALRGRRSRACSQRRTSQAHPGLHPDVGGPCRRAAFHTGKAGTIGGGSPWRYRTDRTSGEIPRSTYGSSTTTWSGVAKRRAADNHRSLEGEVRNILGRRRQARGPRRVCGGRPEGARRPSEVLIREDRDPGTADPMTL